MHNAAPTGTGCCVRRACSDRLLGELVFVGGQVAELLVTDPAAVRVRPTDDVDVVVPVTTRTEYHAHQILGRARAAFANPMRSCARDQARERLTRALLRYLTPSERPTCAAETALRCRRRPDHWQVTRSSRVPGPPTAG